MSKDLGGGNVEGEKNDSKNTIPLISQSGKFFVEILRCVQLLCPQISPIFVKKSQKSKQSFNIILALEIDSEIKNIAAVVSQQ